MSTVEHVSSPFDSIRRVREDGAEFWSARDLAQTKSYDQWRNFAAAVDRARVSLQNQGHDPEQHVAGASKMVTIGSGAARAIDDFHLTRFGAYLTVMNGDPRKPEVAAAQAYFAVKTREAETSTANSLEALVPKSLPEALRAYAREVEAREAAEAYVMELEPKAEAYTAFIDGDGTYSVGTVAKMVGLSQNKLFAELRNHGLLIAKGAMRNAPYQKFMHHFAVKAFDFTRSDGTTATSYTTRIQPSGVEFIRRRLGLAVPLDGVVESVTVAEALA